jgi:hypothetical protein
MKTIKKVKIIMILLLFVTIVFTLLGTFKLNTYEGLDEDDSVPSCPSNLEDLDEDSGSWKIKTSLVPPVCPSGPYFNYTEQRDKKDETKNETKNDDKKTSDISSNKGFFSGFNIGNKSKGDDNSTNTEITQNSDYYNKQIQETNLTNNSDNSVRQNTNTSQNVNMDNSVNQDMSQTQTASADSKFNNLLGNNSIMFGSFGGGGQNSTTANNTIAATNGGAALGVSTPAPAGSTATAPYQESNPQTISMINDLKGTVAKLNQQKQDDKTGQCPPCPACERCPEPAFECKKVPNYRSPSIDNYMPVPVLNDFSRF